MHCPHARYVLTSVSCAVHFGQKQEEVRLKAEQSLAKEKLARAERQRKEQEERQERVAT